MRWLGVAAILVLTACTSGGPAASTSPSSTASASPSAIASPTPSPVAAMPCRMPASLRVDQGGMREVLGWLSLPSGTTTDDPVNHIIVTGNFPTGGGASQPIWATDHSPQLYGYGLGTYSAAINRWLPAPPELVSADGQHYAYLHPDGTIRLADANGGEAIVPNPNKLTPLAYVAAGVVLTSSDVASSGLWLLDPTTHVIAPIVAAAGNDNWLEVSGTTAWGVDSPGVLGYPPTTSVLQASAVAPGPKAKAYTASPGNTIALIAADRQGGLLIALAGSSPGLVYIGQTAGNTIYPFPTGVSATTLGPRLHSDAHGIWFLGQAGVFLFTSSSGLQKIAPGLTSDVVPGGDCT